MAEAVVGCRERGQAVPLLAAVLGVAAVVALVLAHLGAAAVDRARAQTAADAAALAGAAEGEAAAAAVARANGAELVSFTPDGAAVEVVVRHGDASARATAEATVEGRGPRGLAPALAAAVARTEQVLGGPVRIERVDPDGLGFTVDRATGASLAPVASRVGLCHPGDGGHPVHFAPCPPTSPG